MAQGAIKSKASKASISSKSAHSSKNGITKKGARTIAPKNTFLVKQQKMKKKFSAGLTAKTEKMLGEKVGHLELLGKGKKRKDEMSKKGDKGQAKKG
jgi:Protein of unknown function (DUF2462)